MTKMERFKEFIVECGRVLRVTRKPTKEEYKVIAKVAGLGILLIGFVGFIFSIIWELTSIVIASAAAIILVLILFFIRK